MFAEIDDAAEYTEALAEKLETTVEGLRDLDGRVLVEREIEFLQNSDFSRRFGRPRTAPIRDGELVRDWPYAGRLADVPLLIGSTRGESRFWYDLKLPDGKVLTSMAPPASYEQLSVEVSRLIKLYYSFSNAPTADAVTTVYKTPLARTRAHKISGSRFTRTSCSGHRSSITRRGTQTAANRRSSTNSRGLSPFQRKARRTRWTFRLSSEQRPILTSRRRSGTSLKRPRSPNR